MEQEHLLNIQKLQLIEGINSCNSDKELEEFVVQIANIYQN